MSMGRLDGGAYGSTAGKAERKVEMKSSVGKGNADGNSVACMSANLAADKGQSGFIASAVMGAGAPEPTEAEALPLIGAELPLAGAAVGAAEAVAGDAPALGAGLSDTSS